ncbi:MAG: tyrosine-protein phosphatase [Caulobacterales bacterium]
MRTADHPDRLPPLSGGCNFRDLGGYSAQGGKTVRTGKVYRSGTLADLTPEDHDVINRLELRAIYDLRTTGERARRPSRLPQAAPFEVWSRDYSMSSAELIKMITAPGANLEFAQGKVVDFYRTLAYEQSESYRALFLGLAEEKTPLAFHCSAGKDRTGVAAALILDLLGVARETVVEDYVFTNRYYDRLCQMMHADPESNHLADVDESLWYPLMRAESVYIETMFNVVESRHGSSEGFLRDALNLDADVTTAIRRHLLV